VYKIVYRFPLAKPELLAKWMAAMRRDKWTPKATDVICSEHFDRQCLRVYCNTVHLKEDAVPTLFSFPAHLQKPVCRRRVLSRPSAAAVSPAQSADADTPSTSTGSVSAAAAVPVTMHHSYATLASPRGVKRKYEQIAQREKRRRVAVSAKLKNVRRQLVRCRARLHTMRDVITELKRRRDITAEAVALLERCFGDIPAEMLKRKLKGHNDRCLQCKHQGVCTDPAFLLTEGIQLRAAVICQCTATCLNTASVVIRCEREARLH